MPHVDVFVTKQGVSYFTVLLRGRSKLSDEVPVFPSRAAQNAIVCTVLPNPCVHMAATSLCPPDV